MLLSVLWLLLYLVYACSSMRSYHSRDFFCFTGPYSYKKKPCWKFYKPWSVFGTPTLFAMFSMRIQLFENACNLITLWWPPKEFLLTISNFAAICQLMLATLTLMRVKVGFRNDIYYIFICFLKWFMWFTSAKPNRCEDIF